MQQSLNHKRPRAFTMVELMTVLTIIVILVTILIPVVGSVRRKAQAAAATARLSSIAAAIERYHQTFQAYPGPLPDGYLYPYTPAGPGFGLPPIILNEKTSNSPVAGPNKFITPSENLVLGLSGGLAPRPGGGFDFDKGLVGRGPRSQNAANPKVTDAFLDITSGGDKLLTVREGTGDGDFMDQAGEAYDSLIPELLDGFATPLPIIYLRARQGAPAVIGPAGTVANPTGAGFIAAQYNLDHLLVYTMRDANNRSIGEGKIIKAKEYVNPQVNYNGQDFPHGLQSVDETKTLNKNSRYPFDAFPYFNNRSVAPTNPAYPNATGTAKQKDRYMLICAGPDRVYGTTDDITQSGSIMD